MVVRTAGETVEAKKSPPPFYGKEDRRYLWAMYPHNIEPLPDAFTQKPHYFYVNDAISAWFADRDDVVVGGDNFVYHRDGDSQANFAPDCFVAIGVNKDEVTEDGSYYVWRAGKMIDFAMEIASRSTADKDLRAKYFLYESLAVPEYWMLDPTGGRLYGVPLMGYRCVDGVFVPIPVDSSQPGVVVGYCEILGLEFRWNEERQEFRIVDPVSGKYFVTYVEYRERAERAEAALAHSEAALTDSEAARIESELALRQTDIVRRQAEERARAERDARQEAEQRAEAKAERLRAESDARQEAEQRAETKAERMRAERDARQESEERAQAETERADAKAERMRAERDARQEAEQRAQAEAERAQVEAERLQAERDVRQEAEQRAQAEAERAQAEAEQLRVERDARQEAEQRAQAEAERLQAERDARQEAEQRAQAEAERAQAAEAEAERLREALRALQGN